MSSVENNKRAVFVGGGGGSELGVSGNWGAVDQELHGLNVDTSISCRDVGNSPNLDEGAGIAAEFKKIVGCIGLSTACSIIDCNISVVHDKVVRQNLLVLERIDSCLQVGRLRLKICDAGLERANGRAVGADVGAEGGDVALKSGQS